MTYTYDLADRIASATYPSGREVEFNRSTEGRVTSVRTRKSSTDPWADVATSIAYQPFSNIVQALDYGNGLNIWNTYTQDYELDVLGLYDGTTDIINRAHTRTDNLNLTNIWDNVSSANNQSFWYTAANRLQNADGPWGSKTFYYDGVGNRTHALSTPTGGSQTTDVLGYPANNNRVSDVTRGTQTLRQFTYDAAGNMTSDVRSGSTYAYTYNAAGRLKTVSYEGNLRGTYTYNGLEQLTSRVIANLGPSNGTLHTVHDARGNIIAEADGSGNTIREYIWLPDGGYAGVDMPLAIVDGVNTATPATYYVHTDHLSRPIRMSDASKAMVWQAEWTPWGAPHSITAAPELMQRFPGQWYQLEADLHYNWHRHYDPTLGRYTQPDPLGFVDGPSVYAYARNNPPMYVDPDGRVVIDKIIIGGIIIGRCAANSSCRTAVYNFCKRFLKDESGGPKSKPKEHRSLKKGSKKRLNDKHTKPRAGRPTTKNRLKDNFKRRK